MKNPFSGIFNIKNLFKSVQEPIIDFRKSRKYERKLKCTALVLNEIGLAEPFNAITDESSGFLIIPELMRMCLDVHPFYINGEKYVICPEKYHNTANIYQLSGLANALDYECDIFIDLSQQEQKEIIDIINNSKLSYEIFSKLHKPITALKIHVKNIKGTLNLNLFNNDFSSDFAHFSFKVTTSKILTFLEDSITRKVFILSLILSMGLGILIGIFLGSIGTTFITSIIFMILK